MIFMRDGDEEILASASRRAFAGKPRPAGTTRLRPLWLRISTYFRFRLSKVIRYRKAT